MKFPITQAVRFLRKNHVDFEPYLYDYIEKGGTKHSSEVLGVDEHSIIKTIVLETNERKPLIVLMHGNLVVSTKQLAREINVKSIVPTTSTRAQQITGYLVGGTSPFGTRTKVPIYVEQTVFRLRRVYINGGKRGFLVAINPAIIRQTFQIKEVNIGIEKE
ncbi:MAG: YbaK/EbsC family protein [Pyrinomonadaceae bacterium]